MIGGRTYPGRFFTGSDESDHGTPATLQNMSVGTSLALLYFDSLPTSDATIWSRVTTGQVYNSFRFTGTTFRRRIQTSATALDIQATYANLPHFGEKKWMVVGTTWRLGGAAADLGLFSGDHDHLLSEATAYSARVVGTGAITSDAALNFRLGNRGGAADALEGIMHTVFLRRDYIAGLGEMQEIAQAMLEQVPLDRWRPTLECVLGANESGPVYDRSPNALDGTLTGSTLGISPPIRIRRRVSLPYKAPANAYTLTASGGSFTLTGTAANLEFGRLLAAGAGSYTLTGTAANLEFGRYLSAGSGTYTLTGTAANLEFGRYLLAGSGAFALTGTDATLAYGTAGGYTLAANGGTYTLTGTAASLEFGRTLAADAGAVAVTGTDASLECGRVLSAGSGTFALTGTDATLVYGQPGAYTLAANGGTFAVTGTAAALTCGRRITATGTTCTVTGTAAGLRATRYLGAASGAYALTGSAASLLYSAATSTAFTVTRESGLRYPVTRESGPHYPITRQSGPRYDITREG